LVNVTGLPLNPDPLTLPTMLVAVELQLAGEREVVERAALRDLEPQHSRPVASIVCVQTNGRP
jgi:hypothetical protein